MQGTGRALCQAPQGGTERGRWLSSTSEPRQRSKRACSNAQTSSTSDLTAKQSRLAEPPYFSDPQ